MKSIYVYVLIAIIAGAVCGFTGYKAGYSSGYGTGVEVTKAEADKAIQEIRDLLVAEREQRNKNIEAQKKRVQDEIAEGKKYIGNW